MPTPALVLPLAALVTGFFLVAIPTLVLMAVWTAVTVARILFPERPLPFDGSQRRRRRTLQGEAVPVRLRDILEDQALRQSQGAPVERQPGEGPAVHPLFDDLWLRRN
jgi:hypothetical protein